MKATLLFGAGTAKTLTTSDIFVDGSDVYELRGNLRVSTISFGPTDMRPASSQAT